MPTSAATLPIEMSIPPVLTTTPNPIAIMLVREIGRRTLMRLKAERKHGAATDRKTPRTTIATASVNVVPTRKGLRVRTDGVTSSIACLFEGARERLLLWCSPRSAAGAARYQLIPNRKAGGQSSGRAAKFLAYFMNCLTLSIVTK